MAIRGKMIIQSVHVTEKASMLQELHTNESNKSIRPFKSAKYVFVVHHEANKTEIKQEVEKLFENQKCKVVKVNTITIPSQKKRVRGKAKMGKTSKIKKAIVTLREGDSIDFEK